MPDKIVDSDGHVQEKGWDGQYHEQQGVFGPIRETDLLGNPKIDSDWLGNPKAERGLFGEQQRSVSGRPLFRAGSSSAGSDNGAVAFLLLVLMAAIFATALVGWLITRIFRLLARVPFVRFWYDFVVGDDWTVAVGVVVALAVAALLARTTVPAWWLLPVAVAGLLAASVWRVARGPRR